MQIFVSRRLETGWRIGWHLMNLEWWLLLDMTTDSLPREGVLKHLGIARLEIQQPNHTLCPIISSCLMLRQYRDIVRSIKWAPIFYLFSWVFQDLAWIHFIFKGKWENGRDIKLGHLLTTCTLIPGKTEGQNWNSVGFCLVRTSYKIKGRQLRSSKSKGFPYWMVITSTQGSLPKQNWFSH